MISFQNHGLLDLRALRTFGVSAKESDNPIGMFGTGLKYALAILLREGCRVDLFIGSERHEFDVSEEEIRGQAFSFVRMDGQPMAFTTNLGKNWELWQAYRELYCNTIDEPHALVSAEEIAPRDGYTTIHVYGDKFVDVYSRRGDFILDSTPRWVNEGVEFHDRPSLYMYYRGVRVAELPHPARLTYNIVGKTLLLTEDRTLGGYWQPMEYISDALLKSKDKELLRAIVCADGDSYEARDIDFYRGSIKPSAEFMELIGNISFRDIHNFSAVRRWKDASGKRYQPDEMPLNNIETKQLQRAVAFLVEMGYAVNLDPIIVTKDLPENIIGCVYEENIYISRRAFMMGTKYVTSTLLEEHLHLRYGLVDETRQLQNHLFDLVISLAERIRGEPL